jgi:hypothetical protein
MQLAFLRALKKYVYQYRLQNMQFCHHYQHITHREAKQETEQ